MNKRCVSGPLRLMVNCWLNIARTLILGLLAPGPFVIVRH